MPVPVRRLPLYLRRKTAEWCDHEIPDRPTDWRERCRLRARRSRAMARLSGGWSHSGKSGRRGSGGSTLMSLLRLRVHSGGHDSRLEPCWPLLEARARSLDRLLEPGRWSRVPAGLRSSDHLVRSSTAASMRTGSEKIEPLAACRLTWSAAPCEYTRALIFAGTLNTGSDTDRCCSCSCGCGCGSSSSCCCCGGGGGAEPTILAVVSHITSWFGAVSPIKESALWCMMRCVTT